jgi:mRNA interferase MazF
MRRGSLYWINLEPAAPPELGKIRPAVVVSNTAQNERLESVVVIPLSARAPEIWPLRVRLDVRTPRPSFAVIPGIRQVSKARLHEPLGQLPQEQLARLSVALTAYLTD